MTLPALFGENVDAQIARVLSIANTRAMRGDLRGALATAQTALNLCPNSPEHGCAKAAI
jgi:hypothetical protein